MPREEEANHPTDLHESGNRESVVLDRLEAELSKLKIWTGLGQQLTLSWLPDIASDRHGEVKGNLILIYDLEEGEALQTLRHEFLDYLITNEVIKPLVDQVNMQKRLIESLIYQRKERIVHRLVELIGKVWSSF